MIGYVDRIFGPRQKRWRDFRNLVEEIGTVESALGRW